MTTTTVDIDFPRATTVDYTDPAEAYAYHALWSALYRDSRVDTAGLRILRSQARIWLRDTATLLMVAPLKTVALLLEPYAMTYEACNGFTPTDFLADVAGGAVNRWLAGDRSVTPTDIVLIIWTVLSRQSRALPRRFAEYAYSVTDRWITDLEDYGTFRDIDSSTTAVRTGISGAISDTGRGEAETYRRLTHLLTRDLFAYATPGRSQSEMKQDWLGTHLLSDLPSSTTATLLAYHTLLATAMTVEASEIRSLRGQLHAVEQELQTRPDLHPLLRMRMQL